MGGALILILLLVIYFLPTIIGWSKKNGAAIMLLNLFLGWTFIGWVVALVWATAHEESNPISIVHDKSEPTSSDKKCPFCAETIKKEAVTCRYCKKDLPEAVIMEKVGNVIPKICANCKYMSRRFGGLISLFKYYCKITNKEIENLNSSCNCDRFERT